MYILLYYTFFNNFPPMKFNQFKYSQLIFFKSIKKYFNNIENLFLWNKKIILKILFQSIILFGHLLESSYISDEEDYIPRTNKLSRSQHLN